LFAFVDYFTPNQTETYFYTGIKPDDFNLAEKAAEKIKGLGADNVIITMGEDGAAVFAKENHMVPAVKVRAVDSTAAGDTFVSAFAARLAAGDGVKAAVEYANKAAAISVTRKGAQQSIPYKAEVDS